MFQSVGTNKERQEDEILALLNIYDSNEFSYSKKDEILCRCNIFSCISGALEIKNKCHVDELSTNGASQRYFIQHLPPVRLYIELPNDYPSVSPPKFSLIISWLPLWEISFVCQKLDEMWLENEGNEILFLWLEFLRNDLLSFLNIRDTLDVSFLYDVYNAPKDYIKSNLQSLRDDRALNRALFLNPIQFLLDFNKDQHKVELEKNFYTCRICYEERNGQKCIELANCRHIYCRECMKQYIAVKINDRSVRSLSCPDLNCDMEITANEVNDLCPDLFPKYQDLMLLVTLNTMDNVVHCPRVSCQYPAIKDSEDTLASCAQCGYNFCSFCFKVYHGVAPCVMTSDDTMSLIREYQSGDRQKKKLLEQRYGRKQIQIIVEKYLTKEYLNDNAKACPNCQTLITKIDGCNKMICIHCQASFCWLCGKHITTKNAYDHFMANGTACYGRLLEGTDEAALDQFDNIDIIENILWFNEQHVNII